MSPFQGLQVLGLLVIVQILDGGVDGVATAEEKVNNPGADEATAACNGDHLGFSICHTVEPNLSLSLISFLPLML